MIDNYGSDYLYDSIPSLLAPLRGQSRESVEWRFVRLASDPSSDFNLHLYPVTLSDPSHVNSAAANLVPSSTYLLSSPVTRIRRSHSGRSSLLKTSGKGTFWLGIGPSGFEFHEASHALFQSETPKLLVLKWYFDVVLSFLVRTSTYSLSLYSSQ